MSHHTPQHTAHSHSIDMLNGSLVDKIIFFALPLAASSILQQLFNAADLAVVGRFASPQAMAAVGSNGAVINLIISLFVGLSVGANVVIASLIGTGHQENISAAAHTMICVAFLSGIFLTFAGIVLSKPILVMMAAPPDVMNLAILYLRIYFLAMPAIMIFNYGSAILRSKGDSRRPLLALTVAGIINVILNIILVVFFHLHVIGVAAATVVSNIVSAGLTLWFLAHEEETFRLSFSRLSIKKPYLIQMMRIGLPAGLQGSMFSLSNVVIQSAVNSFGASAIAGATAVNNFDFVSYCVINSFAQAAVTFTSQNYSAGKYDRCKKVFATTMSLGVGFSILVVIVMTIFRAQIIGIFTQDPEVAVYAHMRVLNAFVLHFLIGSYEISGGCLRGMNRSLLPAMITLCGTVVLRILYVFLFFPAHRSFAILYRVYPVSWLFTGAVTLTAYFLVRRRLFADRRG